MSSRKILTVDIVNRKPQPDGSIMRELSCRHFQVEPSGGKAKYAERAICRVCRPRSGIEVMTARWVKS